MKSQHSLDWARTSRCIVCLRYPSDPDHIKTRGAGGGDEPENIWPQCREHHSERHRIGLTSFVKKYGLEQELERRGFYWEPLTRRWLKPV